MLAKLPMVLEVKMLRIMYLLTCGDIVLVHVGVGCGLGVALIRFKRR
mgnify:FL=1